MSKYKYGCETVCNAGDVFPAMKDLVDGGMSVYDAAMFVEKDSKGQVTKDRAYKVYKRRVGKTMSRDIVEGSKGKSLKDSKDKDLEGSDLLQPTCSKPLVKGLGDAGNIIKWTEAMNKCLDFGSKILNGKISLDTHEKKKVVQGCFKSIYVLSKLYVDKVEKGKIKF